jgi:hypothetical protein
MKVRLISCAAICLVLTGCSKEKATDEFVKLVENGKIGSSPDEWIELRNSAGEWEKVGLIFGYFGGEHEECEKAIQGLKKVNYARDYRCVAAQPNGD